MTNNFLRNSYSIIDYFKVDRILLPISHDTDMNMIASPCMLKRILHEWLQDELNGCVIEDCRVNLILNINTISVSNLLNIHVSLNLLDFLINRNNRLSFIQGQAIELRQIHYHLMLLLHLAEFR